MLWWGGHWRDVVAVASIEASDNEQYTMQDTMSNVQSRLQWAWNWWSYTLLGTGYRLGIFFLTHLTTLVPGIVCK